MDITAGTIADGVVESLGVNTSCAGRVCCKDDAGEDYPCYDRGGGGYGSLPSPRYRLTRNTQTGRPRRGTRPVLVAPTSPYVLTQDKAAPRKELKSWRTVGIAIDSG